MALTLAGFGPGARFLVPNYYCPTMIAPAAALGMTPVFYPIMANGQPDLQWLLEYRPEGPAAMLAVHFFGLPIPLDAVRGLCDERGMVLIEDCAHAFFGNCGSHPVGACGHYAIASLPKFFPVLEGGLLASQGPGPQLPPGSGFSSELKAVWNLLEAAGHYGQSPIARVAGALGAKALALARGLASRGTGPPGRGLESGPQDVSPEAVRSAALADDLLRPGRLRRVESWIVNHSNRHRLIENRRRNYVLFCELLSSSHSRALFPQLQPGAVPYAFPIRVPDPDHTYSLLRAAGVPAYRWDRFWPGSISCAGDVGRQWGHHVIQLSCHQDLACADVAVIANMVSNTTARRGLGGALPPSAQTLVQ
jgi:perosamine synthetase